MVFSYSFLCSVGNFCQESTIFENVIFYEIELFLMILFKALKNEVSDQIQSKELFILTIKNNLFD